MASPMRTVSIKLPADIDEALDALARRRRSSRSAIVREAIEAFAAQAAADEPPSVVDLAAGLVGLLEGPPDLASHPRHMDGYGT